MFGRSPSFHDGEGLSISLYRDGATGRELIAAVDVFEITSEVAHDVRLRGVETIEVTASDDQIGPARWAGS